MELFKPQWVVLSWPLGLLTTQQRELLEEYLFDDFFIETVRFEAAPENGAVAILGSSQGVVQNVVLQYVLDFIKSPPTEPPLVFED